MRKRVRASAAPRPAKGRKRRGLARFPGPLVDEFAAAKMIGVRSGREHRFTGIWAVVVRGRVFVRSWNDRDGGWREAFRAEPRGEARCEERSVAVRVRPVRGARLLDAIDRAYAEKYDTKASLKWVRGFRVSWRRATTAELGPR